MALAGGGGDFFNFLKVNSPKIVLISNRVFLFVCLFLTLENNLCLARIVLLWWLPALGVMEPFSQPHGLPVGRLLEVSPFTCWGVGLGFLKCQMVVPTPLAPE